MDQSLPAGSSGPWQSCGHIGPYVIKVYTGPRKWVWQVLTCNRPPHRDGNHLWTAPDGAPSHEWDKAARPVHPEHVSEVK
jgi:hypothetical protein